MNTELDSLPELPEAWREAIEEGGNPPMVERPSAPDVMSPARFERYCELRRRVDQFPEFLKVAVESAKRRQRADEALEEWLRPQAIEAARRLLVGKGKSFQIIGAAISGRLRQKPRTITPVGGRELDFFGWAGANGGDFVRFKMKVPALTKQQVEAVQAALPEDLRGSITFDAEPRLADLKKHWKDTGEVPPGFDVIAESDDISIDRPRLESGNDGGEA